tara:strand:+ start:1783 stop:2619 length:837 start_codon:yes stop_codon:yes gene_type:complete
MRKTIYTIFFGTILFIGGSILTSSSNGRAFAANDGNTGAPGETATTCRTCHGAGFGASLSITLKDSTGSPVTTYVPGRVYDVDVTINTTSAAERYGFQMVTLTSNTIPYNAWSQPSTNTRIASAGQRSYAEHNGKSLTNSFSTKWTAPVSGTGDIIFYAGGVAVNNDGSTSGDGGNTTSLSIQEDISTNVNEFSLKANLTFFPIPADDVLYLSNSSENNLNGVVRIIDLNGKLVFEDQLVINSNSQECINLSLLNSGMYMVQLNTSNQKLLTQRIIVR